MKHLHKQRGASLIEVLVATAVIGVLVVGISQFFGNTFKFQRRERILAIMEFIASDIENKLRSPTGVYLSALDQENTALINCLLGAAEGCTEEITSFNNKNPNYFALGTSTGAASFKRITSFPDDPVYYDTQGMQCKGDERSCVFLAETFFYASCPPNTPAVCSDGADSIHVGYQVTQRPNTLPKFQRFNPLPRAIRFITHEVESILGSFNYSRCNPGASLSGIDERGKPICMCTPPYLDRTEEPTSNLRGPICQRVPEEDLTCPDDLIFRGLNEDGTANCVAPQEAYQCVTFADNIHSGEELSKCDTSKGYWVQEIIRTGCRFHCRLGKSANKKTLGKCDNIASGFPVNTDRSFIPDNSKGCCQSIENSSEAKNADQRNSSGKWLQLKRPLWNPQISLLEEVIEGKSQEEETAQKKDDKMGLVCELRRLKCCRAK